VIFAASFFFDFGFAIYFFQFNLYLLVLHFSDRWIGLVGGAGMLGGVVGLLPAGLLTRRVGLRPMMIACFVAAPVMGVLRAISTGTTPQLGLAFLGGLAMCLWGVCFLPAVARYTTEENRSSGFSLIFATSIATSMLGGVVCGYLPQWLSRYGIALQPVEVKRLILLASCAIAAMGILPVLQMRLPHAQADAPIEDPTQSSHWRRLLKMDPFLLRFLPAMALWTVVLTAFTPFANVYLTRNMHVPQLRIGLTFSAAQVIHLVILLLTPMLFRVIGLVNGIVVTQVLSGITLVCLAGTQSAEMAVAVYLSFVGVQFMSSPGLYTLLMNNVPEDEQSAASSMTLFCNALVGAGATALAGILFTRFGYPPVLAGIGAVAVLAAMLFFFLVGPASRRKHAMQQL
jgi:MFS family permease